MDLQQQPNVSIEQTSAVVCEECGNETFVQALYLRSVSPLLTGTGERGIIPIPTFICTACNNVNEQFKLKIVPELD